MKYIAIIGVGQLGSRHLQGLTYTNSNIKLELVEPNKDMREIALKRYKQMPKNDKIHSMIFLDNISELSEELDLVIVATTAIVRRLVVDELLDKKKVKNIILEKVLFQNYNDYNHFAKRFKEYDIHAWVNHPRRLFPFYEQFIDNFKKSSRISYHVQGGEWGMACNALHFLDHLQMMQKDSRPEIEIDTSFLLPEVTESKRKGCFEVYGTLNGTVGSGTFSLTCIKGSVIPVTISIMTDTEHIIVNEQKETAFIAKKENEWQWIQIKEKIIFYQSELTGFVLDEILQKGSCSLPTYQESLLLHKPFIKKIQDKIECTIGKKMGFCPIT